MKKKIIGILYLFSSQINKYHFFIIILLNILTNYSLSEIKSLLIRTQDDLYCITKIHPITIAYPNGYYTTGSYKKNTII